MSNLDQFGLPAQWNTAPDGSGISHKVYDDCHHDWEWMETGETNPGDTHYHCKLCDTYKTVHADGSEKLDEL